MTVHFDAGTWTEESRTPADALLYGAAREIATNAVKHARAQNLWIELGRSGNDAGARLRRRSRYRPDAVAHSVQDGHIGMASTRAKVQAAGGTFTVRPTTPGTEVEISVPVA